MTIQFRRAGLAALICAAALLTACGGGSPSTSSLPDDRQGPDPHTPEPTPKDAPPRGDPSPSAGGKPLPAHVTVSGGYTGIGPAVSGQRPKFTDLGGTTETTRQEVAVRSGKWRDRSGRDGSSSASEVVRYIRSYQNLATREARHMGRDDSLLFFVDFGRQKTLRMHGASPREAELVRTALQEINTALPWERRILLGEDLTAPLSSPPSRRAERSIFISRTGSATGRGIPMIRLTGMKSFWALEARVLKAPTPSWRDGRSSTGTRRQGQACRKGSRNTSSRTKSCTPTGSARMPIRCSIRIRS